MYDETAMEQQAWEYYKKIESDNYYLKQQLTNKEKEIKHLKRGVSSWKKKYEKLIENKRRN